MIVLHKSFRTSWYGVMVGRLGLRYPSLHAATAPCRVGFPTFNFRLPTNLNLNPHLNLYLELPFS